MFQDFIMFQGSLLVSSYRSSYFLIVEVLSEQRWRLFVISFSRRLCFSFMSFKVASISFVVEGI